jgi:acyl-CoA thioesterase-1
MSELGEACMSVLLERGRFYARLRALGRYSASRAVFNNDAALPLREREGRARAAGWFARLAAIFFLCLAPVAAQAGTRVVALGDSLTAGLGLPPDQSFPARLQQRLAAAGTAVEVVNAGVSGDTSAGGLARLDWALGDHPDVVLIELGANDALRGIDPKQTYANLDKILARVKASGARVLLLGMLAPPNWGRDYEKEFDAIYPALAKKYQVPLYPFFLDGVAMAPGLNQEDGIHPNKAGVEIIVGRVAPYVQRLLDGKGAQG